MLQTYLGNSALKTAFLGEITKHEEADQLTKGTYGRMNGVFQGCAIGCALHSLNILQGKTGDDATKNTGRHIRYEAELGLPIWFAYMEDHLFENLPNDLARTWPRRLAEAIPVGAVLDDRFLAKVLWWSLADGEFGVRHATDNAEVRGWIDTVAACLLAESAALATASSWSAVERAAWEARAARAAWAARDARAAMAAWAAWAEWDARAAKDAWAARAARDAWAARAARDAWAARAARDAWAAWDAREARDAWEARDARAARAAWAAWAAMAAMAAMAAPLTANSETSVASRKKAAAYYPALSEYILSLLRELSVPVMDRA